MDKIKLGQKIKNTRKMRGVTQSLLADGKVTRNMLSRIENGAAYPSIETLEYIAEGLRVPLEYLLSEDDNLFFFEKKQALEKIYRAYEAKNYQACVNLINSLSGIDNELAYILASSYLELGKHAVAYGSLLTAQEYLNLSLQHCEKTKINTENIEAQIYMQISIAKNIQSPLLEFDLRKYTGALANSVDFEFFKYLTLDFSYAFENPVFSLHMEAKKLMREMNYQEAVKRLLNATELSKNEDYNAFVIFGIYTDLEYCYKQLYKFENAYSYASKRMTLIEEFKS